MFSRILLIVLFLAVAAPVEAGGRSFTGTWASEPCVVDPVRQHCPGFTLVLVQKGQRLCGSHFAATSNFSRVDEGAATSVIGTVIGREAVVFIASGRDPTSYLARARMTRDGLAWRVVERLADGGDIGAPVISLSDTLHRSSAPDWQAKTADTCEARFQVLP